MDQSNLMRIIRDEGLISKPRGSLTVVRGTGTPIASKPKLLVQVRQAVRTRHYSYRTEKAYVHWIKRFIFFQQVPSR